MGRITSSIIGADTIVLVPAVILMMWFSTRHLTRRGKMRVVCARCVISFWLRFFMGWAGMLAFWTTRIAGADSHVAKGVIKPVFPVGWHR